MPRSTHVVIDPSAFVRNLQRARALAPASRLWAVVKADAYGHGLVALHSALAEADGAALIEFDQARELRVRGWHKPVLMLEGAFDLADTRQAAALKLDLTVHESRQVEWLGQLPADARVNVHLKLNTGMNRLGLDAAEVILGDTATPESLAALQAKLGLDRPALQRYTDWVGGLLQGRTAQRCLLPSHSSTGDWQVADHEHSRH